MVYSIKFNLRAESPRDYADILLSWKHFPNVSIYDFARGLATHTNLREPEKFTFSPHEGRLAEATTDNLQLAGEGKLKGQFILAQNKENRYRHKLPPNHWVI